ncbi:unnamed protein product [Urochloa humidicola]
MESIAGDPSTTVSVRAYHVLKIDGYSRSYPDAFSNIHCINSCPFRAGGYIWIIRFFPNGDRRINIDFMSFFLVLCDNVDEAATAEATFSLLDQDQKPVLSYSRTTDVINLSESHSIGCHDFIKRKDMKRSKFLKNGCFAIRVDIHIVKKVPSMVVPPSDMHHHLLDLFLSKEGADVELRVGDETFAAHRLILGARSSVFKAELFDPVKEGVATNNVIQIDDLEAPVVRAMLTFIYTDVWPDMDHQDEFAMTQGLLVAADRYNIQRLKLLCEDRLCNHIDTGSLVTILALAEKHHCIGLKDACFEFLGSSTTLFAVTRTEEFSCLAQSYPDIIYKLLIFNAIARYREKGKFAGWSPESQDSVIKIPYTNLSSKAENSEHCTSII